MDDARLQILFVVRRYGPVGGMERYVWEVTRELVALGHDVEVLCERCHAEKPARITVHELGEIAPKPRWLSLLRFGSRARRWLKRHPRPVSVIHSKERLAFHDITTFHGPPFATVRMRAWWKNFSIRVAMQLYLERRELATARVIVPNSHFIHQQLAQCYPEYSHKLSAPIVPGVMANAKQQWTPPPADGGVIGFVGSEWKRKGLELAVEIFRQMRLKRPKLELWVVGPPPAQVRHLFDDLGGGYQLLGKRDDVLDLQQQFDVLLHPAVKEPFGMVITEALASQVRVVVSNVCGAASEVTAASGEVVDLHSTADIWTAAVERQLRVDVAPPMYTRGWRDVAREYEALYRRMHSQ